MIGNVLLFILGLVIIIFGGNQMVNSASRLSIITKIPQSLIGATIVSLATTLPELNVVIFARIDGYTQMAVGNSIGSIIFNITFILSIVFFFTKSNITMKTLGFNFFIMLFTIIVIYVFGLFNVMNRVAGMILLSIFLMFFINSIIEAKSDKVEIEYLNVKSVVKSKIINSLWATILIFCISSFFVSMGAKLLVQNGEAIARILNINEHVIGVTIIAIGTSLPEVVTAISSVRQNSAGIAIGNTIGANILSSTLLLGISAIIESNGLVMHQNITYVALPLIILSSLIILIPVMLKKNLYKLQGILLFAIFIFYYCTVIMK